MPKPAKKTIETRDGVSVDDVVSDQLRHPGLSRQPVPGRDSYGLLTGTGNVSKNVKIKDLKSVNMDALRYYIRQALELDAR